MSARRDLVGIGASAGGLPALTALLKTFRPAAPATMFVVMHRAAEGGNLHDIIASHTDYEVCEPVDGQSIRHGCIYLAPHDDHMLVGGNHIHLRRGPHENNFRPAIDPLFRSLAVFAGGRATGVVLSGYLDGAAGARAIVSAGGALMVQDPIEAASASMPRSAISAVREPESIAKAETLGEQLSDIVAEPARVSRPVDERIRMELMIAGLENATMAAEDRMGELAPYNCPDCNGVLWAIEDGPVLRYRCHTGHAYTQMALDRRQEEMLERSLYDSLRALREKAALLREIASRDDIGRARMESRARKYDEDAETVERMLLSRRKRSA